MFLFRLAGASAFCFGFLIGGAFQQIGFLDYPVAAEFFGGQMFALNPFQDCNAGDVDAGGGLVSC